MKAVRSRGWMLATFVVLGFGIAACGDSTAPGGFGTDELTTELAVTPSHIHAFQTTVTFTVAVTDPDGSPVTDFDVLQVERRAAGTTDAYSVMEAALDGDFYVVDHLFEGSGEYDIRVTGLRPSDADLVVLHEETSPLEVVKAHEDVGGYKVEFEPDPGHIHEGDTSTIQFWVLDDATDDPITGLTVEIFVVEPTAGETTYPATEGTDGLYYADHTFDEAGTIEMGIRLTGLDAQPAEWSIDVEVHEPH